jgi:D-hexose-6-phosphate mutarotase
MANVQELNQRFAVPGVITIAEGKNGMPRIRVTSPAAEAEIYLHGAHVTHYQPKGHKPVLFMSGESLFDPAKAIRGGVPLIFPWFGPNPADPKAPQHGFARATQWTVKAASVGADAKAHVVLGLGPSDATRTYWPHDFDVTFTIDVGKTLDMTLDVLNKGASPIRFEEALHTYLAVADVRQTKIDGLGGRTFIDKVDKAARKQQASGSFTLGGETDRVYLDSPDTVTVDDMGNGRKIVVSKSGSASTVVWNPWVEKAKAMSDFGDEEWPHMLCIETANAADNAVTLAPHAHHVMKATVSVQ